MAKTKAGLGVCSICGEGVVWKVSDTGSLSYTCQHCDFRAYAPAHCDAAKAIAAKFDAPKAEPKPAVQKTLKNQPEPKADAAPVPKPKAPGIWDHLTKQAAA